MSVIKYIIILLLIPTLFFQSNSVSAVITKSVNNPMVSSAKDMQYVDGYSNSLYAENIITIGDNNHDGYPDFLVSGRYYNTYRGRVWIYFTGPDGLDSNKPAFTITGEPDIASTGSCFGHSTVNLGDVNGDGITDYAVGGPGSYGGWQVGKAYVFYENSSKYPADAGTDANQSFTSPKNYDWFGETMVSVHDFNGDGFPDLAIGAPSSIHGGGPDAGYVYVFFGNGHGFSSSANITLEDNLTNTGFGLSLSSGDLNADGLTDIIVSAYYYKTSVGRVDVFYGRKNSSSVLYPDVILNAPNNTYNFGNKVSVIKNFTNESSDNLLVQFTYLGNSSYGVGLYNGKNLINSTNPEYILSSGVVDDWFGQSMLNIGDINNDGYDDFAIGAPGSGIASSFPGTVYVYYGGPNATLKPAFNYTGENPNDLFGFSIMPITINGSIQLLIGSYGYNEYTGRVYLTLPRLAYEMTTTSQTTSQTRQAPGFSFIIVAPVFFCAFYIKKRWLRNKFNKI